jgi:hypothetical protein
MPSPCTYCFISLIPVDLNDFLEACIAVAAQHRDHQQNLILLNTTYMS